MKAVWWNGRERPRRCKKTDSSGQGKVKEMSYLDFHVHTTISDGMFSPEAVIAEARKYGIKALAITDHNRMLDLKELRQSNPDIFLVQGSEISCIYEDIYHVSHEIHVVALDFDPENSRLQNIFNRKGPDRRPYVEKILNRLADCGIHIGTYDDLEKDYPGSHHIGRSHIADKMRKLGYVDTAEEAFDEYIGAFGKRRAYVEAMLPYISLEECTDAILSAGGIAVLAHLFYYRMDEAADRELVRYFKTLTDEHGGMETSYGRYSEEQREYLRRLADENHLLHSAGSDFHGRDDSETMNCKFPCAEFLPLLYRLGWKL